MRDNSCITKEQERRNAVEKMILNHYNNTLLEQGLITPEQHRKMCAQIALRKPAGMTNQKNGPEFG